jgi:predicted metal-dependent hydrolase
MVVAGIEIKIIRSKRKTVSIFVERDGSVSARVPEDITYEKIKEVVLGKQYLIHKHLAEWEQMNENKIDREYVNGQSFLYLGRNYRLKIADEDSESLLLRNGYFILPKKHKEKAKDHFIRFYKEKLNDKIEPIVESLQSQLGVTANDVKIMELQNRWASCSTKGNIHFHWKCAMAPIDVLNYIVLHELVHLKYQNHTPAFWNEIDKIMPGYEKHVHWLKLYGAGMDI